MKKPIDEYTKNADLATTHACSLDDIVDNQAWDYGKFSNFVLGGISSVNASNKNTDS